MSSPLPTVNLADSATGCCPRFDPAPWDGKEFDFEGLDFVVAKTRSLFYMPLNMTKVMTRAQAAIRAAGAEPKDRYLLLSKDISPWKAEHRFLVAGAVPGMPSQKIQGTWLAKVFEGSYSKMGEWYGAMAEAVAQKGGKVAEFMAFYTTCPACAKAYGKNYVVLFARMK